jgi:ferritin
MHLFLWLVFFSLPMLFRPKMGMGPDNDGLFPTIPLPIFMNNIFLIIAFYINLLVLMPGLFNKKKWGLYIFFVCVFLLGSFLVHHLARELDMMAGRGFKPMGFGPERPPGGFEFRQFSFLYTFAMIWAISMVYYLMFQLQESKQHAERVYASALQSELSFLKAQINPHFLFNTLNNIYALTLKKSEDAPKAVMKLSNLMRQLTDDAGVDFVPFEQEEKFIRDYIELQEMRLTDKTNVRYETNGHFKRLNIAPRLLIPFIDNAFKYGVSNRNASEIIIRLDFNDTWLTFMVQNALHKGDPENQEESTGVGLENVHRRLDLLYKGKYTLKNSQTKDFYLVQLEIDLS